MSSFLRTSSGDSKIPVSASKVQFSSVQVPGVSGKFETLLWGGGGVAEESLAEIQWGHDISLINSCDEVCGGVIGSTGTKFCGRSRDLCEIKSHAQETLFRDEGRFVR